MESTDEFIRIVVLDGAIESQLVTSVLEERGIPHRMRSYHDTAYDGLYQVQKGWGEIWAPAGYKTEIDEIVGDLRSKVMEEDDAESPEAE